MHTLLDSTSFKVAPRHNDCKGSRAICKFCFMSRSEQLYIEHWKILWLTDLEKKMVGFSRVIFGTHKKAF